MVLGGDHVFAAHCTMEDRFFEDQHVRRCPIFALKPSEEQNMVTRSADVRRGQIIFCYTEGRMVNLDRIASPASPLS